MTWHKPRTKDDWIERSFVFALGLSTGVPIVGSFVFLVFYFDYQLAGNSRWPFWIESLLLLAPFVWFVAFFVYGSWCIDQAYRVKEDKQ